jgi:glycosyltransferase involved in cell wall biosynthesis
VKEDPGFAVEIAGDGPCRGELIALADQLGLAGRHLRFLGQIKEIPQLLARSDVFVLPSLSEGISLTLLEAIASGMAVAATRVGGNPEVVADDETGLLVPAADPQALASALLRLRQQRELNRRLGRAGRVCVESRFDIRRMVAAYEALYQRTRRFSGTFG